MKTKLARIERKGSFQKKKLFLPIFLAAIMVFSAFAIILSSYSGEDAPENPTSDYKGYDFSSQYGSWTSTVNGRQLTLRYSPFELESLHTEIDLAPFTTLLASEKTYLSVLPEEQTQIPLQELYTNLKPYISQIFVACAKDGIGCEELPLKTCTDASETTAVILLQEGEELTFENQKNCYTLTGTELALTQVIDKLILSLHGL
tara:strand:+ start:6447 stop:7055 length:609 start_codon:yes stop_codon:yes gene_type:complete